MRPRMRWLVVLVAVLLLGNIAGVVISIIARWPAEFGGVGDPDRVAQEFLTRGTLLAAPLAPLVMLVVGLVLALRPERGPSMLGLVVLVAIGVLFVIGNLGEPTQPQASDPPVLFLIAWRALFIAASAALAAHAAVELVMRVRERRMTF